MKSTNTNRYNIFLSLLVILFAFPAKAQINQLQTATTDFEGQSRTCLRVIIEPEARDAEKALSKYLKKTHGVKVSGGDVLMAEEVVFGAVSGKKMDMYTQVEEVEEGSEMVFFARFGYDIFLTPEKYPDEFAAMRTAMDDFLREYLTEYYQDQIEDMEDNLNDDLGEREKIVSSSEKLKEGIDEKKGEIEELQSEILESHDEIDLLEDSRIEMSAKIVNQEQKIDAKREMLINVSKR
jgi:hypothetical protein